MVTSFNNLVNKSTIDSHKEKKVATIQYVNKPIKITRVVNIVSTFVKIFDEINVFENEIFVNTSGEAAKAKAPVTKTI